MQLFCVLHSDVFDYICFTLLHKIDRFFKLNFSLGNIITMNNILDEQRGVDLIQFLSMKCDQTPKQQQQKILIVILNTFVLMSLHIDWPD